MDRGTHRAVNRYAFKREAPSSRAYMRCQGCGACASGAESAFCPKCGDPLIVPLLVACLGCGSEAIAPGDLHCGACGAYVPRASRPVGPARAGPSSHRALRALAAVAVAAGLWIGAQGLGLLRGSLPGAPSLAGIKVGDAQQAVERRIGKPEVKPTEVFWNGADGKAHRVGLWKYGLSPDSEVADLTVTFLDGRVYQVGALDKMYRTSEGLRVGDRIDKASRLYGTPIEENLVSGLMPMKYVKHGIVVKIVTMPGDDRVLAVGIESPRALPIAASDDEEPQPEAAPDSPKGLDKLKTTPL